MSEQRKHPRRKSDAPLILIDYGPGNPGEGVILRDVSLGGLAFETRIAMRTGDAFGFALYVPSRGWVDGKGKVCWVQPRGPKSWLCGAEISIERWNQERLVRKWLHPSSKGVLRFFFMDPPADQGTANG